MTLARLITRLLSRSVRQWNGCLVVGLQSKRRYWSVVYDGKKSAAHRAMWEYHNGPIPDGMEVCHSCDNTRCIEIKHLVCQTHAWNMADRDAKGRNGTLGEASPLAKLTADRVLAIYEAALHGRDFGQIAGEFLISRATVVRIAQRKTWKHLLLRQSTTAELRPADSLAAK